METYVNRLVDAWQMSQPLHLRHLAIVRDILLRGRSPVHLHYTFGNFKKLVESGNASWEAVTVAQGVAEQDMRMSPDAEPDVDEYGFPSVDPKLFQGASNDASLAECGSTGNAWTRIKKNKVDPEPNPGNRSASHHDLISAKKSTGTEVIVSEKEKYGYREIVSEKSVDGLAEATQVSCNPPSHFTTIDSHKPRGKQSLTVKKGRGRPRKYADRGVPSNIDRMDFTELSLLRQSRNTAEKYQKQKIRNEIDRRVEDGESSIPVTHEVLVEMDDLLRQQEREPLEPHLRAQILYEHAGGPMPPASELELALETAFARLGDQIPVMLYLPSVASHSRPILLLEATKTHEKHNQPQPKNNRKPPVRRPKRNLSEFPMYQYLPSIAAHSRIFLPLNSQPLSMSTPKKMEYTKPNVVQNLKSGSHQISTYKTRAATIGEASPLTPPPITSATPIPVDTVALREVMAKRYNEQLKTLNRSKNGIFIANKGVLRRRRNEPPVLPAAYYRLAVVKLESLKNSDWMNRPRSESVQRITQESRADLAPKSGLLSTGEAISSIPESSSCPPIRVCPTTRSSSIPPDAVLRFGARSVLPYITPHRAPESKKRKRDPNTDSGEIHVFDSPIAQRQKTRHMKPDAPSLAAREDMQRYSRPTLWITLRLGRRKAQLPALEKARANKDSQDEPRLQIQRALSSDNGLHGRRGDERDQYEAHSRHSHEANGAVPTESEDEGPSKVLTLVERKSSVPSNSRAAAAKQTGESKLRTGRSDGTGSTAILRRDIIMNLIKKCGGVAPGFRELYVPFVSEWSKKGQAGVPDPNTVKTAVRFLCDAGRLRQITFSFQTQLGVNVTKSMLILPDISADDPRTKEIQNEIIGLYPRTFFHKALIPPETSEGIGDESAQRVLDTDSANARKRKLELEKRMQSHKELIQKIESDKDSADSLGTLQLRQQSDHETTFQGTLSSAPSTRSHLVDTASVVSAGSRLPASITNAAKQIPRRKVERLASLWRPGGRKPARGSMLPPLAETAEAERSPLQKAATRYQFNLQGNFETQQHGFLRGGTDLDQEDNARQRMSAIALPTAWMGHNEVLNNERLSSMIYTDSNPDYYKSPYAPNHPSSPEPNVESEIDPWKAIAPPPTVQKRPNATKGVYVRKWYKWNLYGGFANPDQAFHASTGTFATSFSGLLPPRKENFALPFSSKRKRVHSSPVRVINPLMAPHKAFHITSGTYGTSFPVLPLQSTTPGPKRRKRNVPTTEVVLQSPTPSSERASSVKQASSTDTAKIPFYNEVDRLLDWELNKEGLADISISDWPFINHRPPPRIEQRHGRRPRIVWSVFDTGEKRAALTAPETPEESGPHMIFMSRPLNTVSEKRPSEYVEPNVRPELNKRRRIHGPAEFRALDAHEETQLLTSVMVIRSITGGLEKRIDWALVGKVFEPNRDLGFIRGSWGHVLQRYKAGLDRMETDFQELFLKAYEKGTIPAIDYDNLIGYDWKWLVEWTMGNINGPIHTLPDLPGHRSELDDLYTLKQTTESSINPYFEIDLPAIISKRQSTINQHPFVYPAKKKPLPQGDDDNSELTTAKTWVRANIATPYSTYNPSLARESLLKFPENVIEEAVKSLLVERILNQENKGRLLPGRNYDISEHFLSRLRKNISASQLRQAALFKLNLDRQFAEQGSAEHSEVAPDGDVMATLDLMAHQRITLVPINPPLNKWGHTDGGYETRRMDKRKLQFPVAIRPLPTYISGNPLLPLPPPPYPHLHPTNPEVKEKNPLWYDIHGSLVPGLWEMVVAAVFSVLLMRPGIGKDEIERTLRPGLALWEVNLVLEWMVLARAAQRVSGQPGSWRYATAEWWWLALGSEDGLQVDEFGDDVSRDKRKEKKRADEDEDGEEMEVEEN